MAKANKQQLPGVMAGARADDAEEAAVVRKVTRRLMWFLFMVSAISYLDRINISFAALSMNKTLGLTGTTYGLATTIPADVQHDEVTPIGPRNARCFDPWHAWAGRTVRIHEVIEKAVGGVVRCSAMTTTRRLDGWMRNPCDRVGPLSPCQRITEIIESLAKISWIIPA